MTARPYPPIYFVVGTDTAVGKTEVTCALLRSLRARGRHALAYKPAMSGDEQPDDLVRLIEATIPIRTADPELPTPTRHSSCAYFFDRPIAPGVADARAVFIGAAEVDPAAHAAALARVDAHFEAFLAQHQPKIVFVEGAGGLHVPMPGGAWLPDWLAHWQQRYGSRCLVVARAGLGTLNHTIATFEGLAARSLDCAGFLVSDLPRPDVAAADPSVSDNIAILEHRLGQPCLGRLRHLSFEQRGAPLEATSWLNDAWFERIGTPAR